MTLFTQAGQSTPLGSHCQVQDGRVGCNFAVSSHSAAKVWLCLFDNDQEYRLPMDKTGSVWHLFVEGVTPGQAYGFRADGCWNPDQGLYLNPAKLLQDPYAYQIQGTLCWHSSVHSEQRSNPEQRNDDDSAPYVPRSIVTDHRFDWADDRHPVIEDSQRVIYELHPKGFTRLFPQMAENLRGTYLGLIEPGVIAYLKALGITTVELLPVTQFLDEAHLDTLGLPNYWGYNPLCMMAPDSRYALEDPVTEFKTMVKGLHQAGFEVIMDVVYNHTAEAGKGGAQLCYKGLDNAIYYRLDQTNPREYLNYSFCGNSLRTEHSVTRQLVLDALRLWVSQYHIDGFRFDLAPSLARNGETVSEQHPFLAACQNDPLLKDRLLIAEPWDIGPDGYALGRFPEPWLEWNDQFRDPARAFWRGDKKTSARFADALCGSAAVFAPERRLERAPVNYLTAHDGFTLEDLVSYEKRHNLANGENNRDGHEPNYSRNYGVEGPSAIADIIARRLTVKRSLLASLLLAKGTPMLLAGDELGNSQQGNNNAYCQDNDISWLDWEQQDIQLLAFTRQLLHLRKTFGTVQGLDHGQGAYWRDLSGRPMTAASWKAPEATGFALSWENHQGRFALVVNNSDRVVACPWLAREGWQLLLDTAVPEPFAEAAVTAVGGQGLLWLHQS